MSSTYQPLKKAGESTLFSPLYLTLRQKKQGKQKKKRVIVIAGPTGVGKTKLSLAIGQILGGEIISADSMQVYKGMDIGTAKATKQERKKVHHHLIDVCEISENYNVVSYYNAAYKVLKTILLEDKVPIVCGGSGFYLHALLCGPPQGPPSEPRIRRKLEALAEKIGVESLFERLQLLDPKYAATISEKDKHKVVRALEIISLTGGPVSNLPKPDKIEQGDYDFRMWFVHMPKDVLYAQVEKRCDEMLKEGFIDEVKALEKKGLRNNYTASQAIGYRQCLEYLKTDQSEKEKATFILEFKKASRHYVKRQFTWFKKEPNFRWLDLHKLGFERAVEYILQDYEQG